MSPEERQLLQGVFDRMRNNASAQRDGEADRLIADNVRQQPYSPYYLTQTVIVQEHALEAANQRIQQLEQQVQQAPQDQGQGGGGFLSSIFGGGGSSSARPPATVPPARPVWNQGGTGQQGGGYPQGGAPQGGGYQPNYAPPPPQGGPWGGQPQQQGGGFLHGALQTAAGVAGGALLFDGIKGLIGGHGSPLGIGAGTPGAGETVINNYYDSSGGTDADRQQDADQNQDFAQDSSGYDNTSGTSADWQQDADQDQDFAQDSGGYDDDNMDI